MGERNLIELISRGVIERKPGRGKYDLDEVRVAYIRHIREKAAGRDRGAEAEAAEEQKQYEAERARHMTARADRAEIELASMRGELVPADEIADAISQALSTFKQKIFAVPSKLAPRLASNRKADDCERLMRDEIKAAFEELSKVEVKG